MKGRRVESAEAVLDGKPGDYTPVIRDGEVVCLWAQIPTGSMARLPATGHGHGAPEWQVTVENDGMVTVHPSIRQLGIPGHTEEWHGWLRRGEWSEA